jgi:hypothetical protein
VTGWNVIIRNGFCADRFDKVNALPRERWLAPIQHASFFNSSKYLLCHFSVKQIHSIALLFEAVKVQKYILELDLLAINEMKWKLIFRLFWCVITWPRSLFWWTNETLNAWTHLLGWMYFAFYTVREIGLIDLESTWHDNIMMIVILVCFQVTSFLQFHVFFLHLFLLLPADIFSQK